MRKNADRRFPDAGFLQRFQRPCNRQKLSCDRLASNVPVLPQARFCQGETPETPSEKGDCQTMRKRNIRYQLWLNEKEAERFDRLVILFRN
jgi:hypothetical protein